MHGRVGLAALLTCAVVALGGGVPAPAPAMVPTGPNGLVAIETTTGLVAIDPATGTRTTLAGSVNADDDPEVSPLSNVVAFENGNQIWAADWPSGANRRQLTTTDTNVTPAFSPDGQAIVFQCLSADPNPNPNGLCTVPTAGGSLRFVAGSQAGDSDPDFDPTGQFVVFQGAAGISRIGLADGARSTLTDTLPGDDHPRVAPNGSVVYFDSGAGIVTLAWPNGGSRTTLTGTSTGDDDPTPSPDGTLVAFDT